MEKHLISVAALVLITGCANTPSEDVSKYGPVALVSEKPGKEANVIDVLALLETSSPTTVTGTYTHRLDKALSKLIDSDRDNSAARRNMLLDRMIHASNELCEAYKTTLKQKQSNANFLYGTGTLMLGSLGGAVSGANAARNLSSLSAISSGMRAEHNQSFYSDQSAQVIVKAIELRRSNMLGALNLARRCTINAYSIPMAMADAVKYHGACSLVGGISQIDNALSSATNIQAGTEALASNAFYQQYLTTNSRTFTVTTATITPSTPTFGSLTASMSPLEYCQYGDANSPKKEAAVK